MESEKISVCLPKGNAMKPLAEYLETTGFTVLEYHSKNRTYRPEVKDLPVRAKIMAEKDVAIQVAVGNYDVGFCGLHWIKEHTIKYKATKLLIYKHLGLDKQRLVSCAGKSGDFQSVEDLKNSGDFITIVSEYPNLSEHFAIKNRLRKFKIFTAWGSVEGYPPEHADVVIMSVYDDEIVNKSDLIAINCELESDLCMIVNTESFEKKNLSPVLQHFSREEVAA